jgi:hypothetical protein
MFRNEYGMFKNRSVIFLNKKCDFSDRRRGVFPQEVRNVPTDRRCGMFRLSGKFPQEVRNVPTDRRCGMFRLRMSDC